MTKRVLFRNSLIATEKNLEEYEESGFVTVTICKDELFAALLSWRIVNVSL